MIYYIKKLFFNHKVQALIFLSIALVITLSLITYNSSDPSFNSITQKHPSNLLSYFGSYLSDLFYQLFGLASFIFPICCFSWAYLLYQSRELTWLSFNIFTMLLTCIAFSTILVHVKPISILPVGSSGAIGLIISPFIAHFGTIGRLSLFLLSFFLLIISLGISLSSYLKVITQLKFLLGKNYSIPINTRQKTSYIKKPPTISNDYMAEPQEEINNKYEVSPSKSMGLKQRKDPTTPTSSILPLIDLLKNPDAQRIKAETASELKQNSEKLLNVLGDFGVKGQIIDVSQGPVVTLYEFEPAAGTKSSRVIGLSDDIARSLSAISTRIAVIPGRNVLGIELPNKQRAFFCLRELIETTEYQDQSITLPLILGKDLAGKPFIADLAKMPHLLVAGTTGSGKSVAINAMIMSLLYRYTPQECRLIMIDPKMLELSIYDNIPHLLTPVVTEPAKAIIALKWAVKEMENRYRLMATIGVRNIASYNTKIMETAQQGKVLERTVQTGFDPNTGKPIYESMAISMEKMPFIVVIVDEMADLMIVAGKDIESLIQRLAQMARAAGIHIIMATQRPSVDVITGVIKANFPSRISFKVTSKIDSRTIFSEQGAEQLLGMGDMLYMGNSAKITRVHGPFVDDKEVEKVTDYLRSIGTPEYISAVTEQIDEDNNSYNENVEDGADDETIYKKAIQIVKSERKVSISYIQRCLRIGYNRAATIIEKMEKDQIISPPNHAGKREILLPGED